MATLESRHGNLDKASAFECSSDLQYIGHSHMLIALVPISTSKKIESGALTVDRVPFQRHSLGRHRRKW